MITTQESVIVIDNLHKAHGKGQAVKSISIRLERGEIFGFLGPM
jgi:ABC-type multidrug transport system ATPase subunit